MLRWFKRTWPEARSSVLREEFDQSLAHLSAFDASQRLQCYRTMADVVHRLADQVGPIGLLSDTKKKQIAKMLSELARELFKSKPIEAYATAFVSMWLESQTLRGDDADYVRSRSSEFIETTLKGYEKQPSACQQSS